METIDLRGQPLDLDLTLGCGQAFRWRKRADGLWSGVVRDRLLELASADGALHWRTYPRADRSLVEDYLRLSDDADAVYRSLAASDGHLRELVERFRGLRLLRQDPAETLLSFVCSAANSIPRISAAIEQLACRYGRLVCERDSSCYYTFPEPAALAEADVSEIEQIASLGFRGANLKSVALQLVHRGEDWLASLRGLCYTDARQELLGIRGVGAKIADCVCLFALDKDDAVPVDTHVMQLSRRLFLPDMRTRTITDAAYRRVCAEFQRRYGALAGWAQQFLFYEDLMRTRAMGRGLG